MLLPVLYLVSCRQQSSLLGTKLIPPPDSLWSRTFSGADLDYGLALHHTLDGGFILAGQSALYRLWTAKINSVGNMEWSATPMDVWDCGGNAVHELSDGGYIFTGGVGSLGGTTDVLLMRTDNGGRYRWHYDYGGNAYDCGRDVEPIPSGGFIIAGVTESYGIGGRDAWIIRTDSAGNAVWSYSYGQIYDDEANRIQVADDGGFVVAGILYTASYDQNNDAFWIFKLSGIGQWLWSRTYNPGPDLYCWGLQKTTDGGYVLGGTYGFQVGSIGGSAHLRLIKMDSLGNQQWTQTYTAGMQLIGSDLEATEDGGFLVTGYVLSATGGQDLFLMKTDNLGQTIWQTILGGNGADLGTGVVATADGACAVSGFTTPLGSTPEFWLIKMDSH